MRKYFREIRRQVSEAYRQYSSITAAQFFIQQDVFKSSEKIACYFPFQDEFDTAPLMEAIWQAQKKLYLPVLTAENNLRFVQYQKDDALQNNRYSIPEPVNTNEISVDQLDIIITPLIAFDSQGNRLGTGGGYYDRTLAFIKDHPEKRPVIIGLGYSSQHVPFLPEDEWDIGLDSVLTEDGMMTFS